MEEHRRSVEQQKKCIELAAIQVEQRQIDSSIAELKCKIADLQYKISKDTLMCIEHTDNYKYKTKFELMIKEKENQILVLEAKIESLLFEQNFVVRDRWEHIQRFS